MHPPTPHTLFSGHNGAVYDAAYWAAAGKWVTAGGDGVVASWTEGGEGTAELHHQQAFFSVAAIGDHLFAGTASGELMIKGLHADPQRIEAHEHGVFALAGDGPGRALSGGGAGQIQQWTYEGGRWQALDRYTVPDGSKVRTLLPGPTGCLVGTSAGWLGTWADGRFHAFRGGSAMGIYAAAIIPGKRAWLVGCGDGHIRVVSFAGEWVYAFPAHQGPVYRLAVAGDVIWSASRDKTVKAWRLADLAPIEKLAFKGGGHTRSVNALHIRRAPAGWELLSGGDDRSARLFRLNDLGYRATSPPGKRPPVPTTDLPG